MSGDAAPIAPWMVRAFQEARRGRHLLLYGNIDDLILWDGDYLPFREALAQLLDLLGYPSVAFYNPVDGLTYGDDGSWFRRLASGRDAAAEEPSVPPPPDDAAETERQARLRESRQALSDAINDAQQAQPVGPHQSLFAIRTVLRSAQEPCAVVVEFTELLVGVNVPPDEHYRDYLVLLRSAMLEAGLVAADGARRNLLVLVCKELRGVPAWLHEGNPLVAPVAVEKPTFLERESYLFARRSGFHGGADLASEDAARCAAILANLTEGMSIRDLDALAATSQVSEIPFDAAKRLTLHHKVGWRDDPWERLPIEKVAEAEGELKRRVIGQDSAVAAVTQMLVNARIGLDFVPDADSASTRPRGVFFFVGPTGVGKTELAKALAAFVFDDENAMRRFDMTEFGLEHASERLTGAPPGYVGYEAGGVLTNWIYENPFSVVLFDEIEKAHEKVFDKFLQIMDDGRLTDGRGRTAYFSNAIVIFTSNLGAQRLDERLGRASVEEELGYEEIKELFEAEVSGFFKGELGRPEFLGRLGSGVVVFDMLRDRVVHQITDKFLAQLSVSAAGRGLQLVYDRPAIFAKVSAEINRRGRALGARQIRDPILERLIRVPLNRWIMDNDPAPGTRVLVHRSHPADELAIGEYPPD